MTNQHPITPPPELVQQWTSLANEEEGQEVWSSIATQAAQWGADQELEACVEWFQEFYKSVSWVLRDLKRFRAARRPKSPSLKEQALALVNSNKPYLDDTAMDIIRQALETQ